MKHYWTPEEDALLRKYWKTSKPIIDFVGKFNDRTMPSIRHRAHVIGCAKRGPGPRPEIEKTVMRMIRKHGPICTADMAQQLLCKPQQVDQYVRRLKTARKIHVAGHVERSENHLSRMWAAGNFPDVKKLPREQRAPWIEIAPSKPKFYADPLMAALYGAAPCKPSGPASLAGSR